MQPKTNEKYPGDPDVIISSLSESVSEFLNLATSQQLEQIAGRLGKGTKLKRVVEQLNENLRIIEAEEDRRIVEAGENIPLYSRSAVNVQLTAEKLDAVLAALQMVVLNIFLDDAVSPLGLSTKAILETHGLEAKDDVIDSVMRALRKPFFGERRGRRKTFDTTEKQLEFLALYNRFSKIIKMARAMKRKRTKDLAKSMRCDRAESLAIDEALNRFQIPLHYKHDLFELGLPLQELVFKWIQEQIEGGIDVDKDLESTYQRTLKEARKEWRSISKGSESDLIDYFRHTSGITLAHISEKEDKSNPNIQFHGRWSVL